MTCKQIHPLARLLKPLPSKGSTSAPFIVLADPVYIKTQLPSTQLKVAGVMWRHFLSQSHFIKKKCLLDIDQKWQCKWITCLKGSQAVRLSDPHVILSWPLKNSFDLPWRHQPPGLSSPCRCLPCRRRWPAQVQVLWLWPSPVCSRSCCSVRLKHSMEQLQVREWWV